MKDVMLLKVGLTENLMKNGDPLSWKIFFSLSLLCRNVRRTAMTLFL